MAYVFLLTLGEIIFSDHDKMAAMWSLEFAISVFVIACPCNIALAAPTALLVGSDLLRSTVFWLEAAVKRSKRHHKSTLSFSTKDWHFD